MLVLARDRARPKAAKLNSRPPGQRETNQHDADECIGPVIANWPDPALAQRLRHPGGNEHGSGKNNGTVDPGLNCGGTLRRAARPEGSRDPTDNPCDPDDLEGFVWLNDQALMRQSRRRGRAPRQWLRPL